MKCIISERQVLFDVEIKAATEQSPGAVGPEKQSVENEIHSQGQSDRMKNGFDMGDQQAK
jgi:hypothetical protein